MPLDYDLLKNWPFPDRVHTYTAKDTILYALGLGIGQDPVDGRQLRFVYERDLAALPTMATVLGYPGFWLIDPLTGLDWRAALHTEQEIVLDAPIPVSGTVIGRSHVESIYDKGPKGAVINTRRDILDAKTGHRIATTLIGEYCRGAGGYGGDPGPKRVADPVPECAPDLEADHATLPQSALIYRLSADDNPLHADPDTARAMGFDRPILHGMCTYGIAGYLLVRDLLGGDPARMKRLFARFTAPVIPGETLRLEAWREGSRRARFRVSVPARGTVVIDEGTVEHE